MVCLNFRLCLDCFWGTWNQLVLFYHDVIGNQSDTRYFWIQQMWMRYWNQSSGIGPWISINAPGMFIVIAWQNKDI